jgi:FkbM family methyltransferase
MKGLLQSLFHSPLAKLCFAGIRKLVKLLGMQNWFAKRGANPLVFACVPRWTTFSPQDSFMTTYKGVALRLNRSDYTQWTYYANMKQNTLDDLVTLCKPLAHQNGVVFIDVGANIGLVSLGVAQRLNSQQMVFEVHAFEPMPKTFAYLKENIGLNPALAPHITTYNLGLSDKIGDATLFLFPSHSGAASMAPNPGFSQEQVSIQLETLDNVLLSKIPVQTSKVVLKVDVEGFELFVLKGATAFIKQHRPILYLEVDTYHLYRSGYDTEQLFSYLENVLDYEITDSRDGKPLKAIKYASLSTDIICKPRS